MFISKYLVILFTFNSTILLADSTCLECLEQRSKYIEGRPSSGALDSLEITTKKVTSKVSSKESYQTAFCDKYEMAQDTVDVENIFEDIDSSPYKSSLEEFWTAPACLITLKTTAKGTILFNTASNTVKNENFPQVVHDYLIEEKNSPEIWLKAINTRSNEGYTFLDYLQYNIDRGYYKGNGTRDAALRIVKYLCKNGGVYSKFKASSQCAPVK